MKIKAKIAVITAGIASGIAAMAFTVSVCSKDVTILDSNTGRSVTTFKSTVEDVIQQNKIGLNPKDKVFPELKTPLKDGMKISIKRAVPIKVKADGKEIELVSAEDTVGDILLSEGIGYGEKDKIFPDLDTEVTENMEIKIVKVTESEITEKQPIPFSNAVKHNNGWEKGLQKVVQEGKVGEKEIRIRITCEDGVETKREVIEEKIIKAPQNKIVEVGTKAIMVASRGENIQFQRVLTMVSTCYTNNAACTGKAGGRTASGTVPRRIPGGGKWSTAAVDPRVIPMGTKLWIEGYGYAIAEDVGGAIKGNKIDVFFTDGSSELKTWGRRTVKVYILK